MREVETVWASAVPVIDDVEASHWLRGRGLDPLDVAERDLARVLPKGASLPPWASFGRPWTVTSHRLIVPLCDEIGRRVTLHARALAPRDPKGRDKAASPSGYEVRGALMADEGALALLRGAPCTTWSGVVIVAEGVPDWLTWSTHFSEASDVTPAVFGVLAGSWQQAIADRIPSGARVLVRAHDDRAGHKYAAVIVATLARRCVVRTRP